MYSRSFHRTRFPRPIDRRAIYSTIADPSGCSSAYTGDNPSNAYRERRDCAPRAGHPLPVQRRFEPDRHRARHCAKPGVHGLDRRRPLPTAMISPVASRA